LGKWFFSGGWGIGWGDAGLAGLFWWAEAHPTLRAGAYRSLTWTIFDMPATVTFGGKTIGFQYDADHNRVLRTQAKAVIPNIYYLPDGEDDSGTWYTFYEVDSERIAESYGVPAATPASAPLPHAYFHNDYQNTNGVDTSDTDVVLQKKGADVFGQPRQQNGSTDPNWTGDSVTTRRFINQEDLVQAHLVDLNARLYDPVLGKFLSPDPYITNQDNSQSWNAYSYAQNNPMSKEDPTGRWTTGASCQGDLNGGGAQDSMAIGMELDSQVPSGTLMATDGKTSTAILLQQAVKLANGGAHFSPSAADAVLGYISANGISTVAGAGIGEAGVSHSQTIDPDLLGKHIDLTIPTSLDGQKAGGEVQAAINNIDSASKKLSNYEQDMIRLINSIVVSDSIARSFVEEKSGIFNLQTQEVLRSSVPFLSTSIAHDSFHIHEYNGGGVTQSRGISAEVGAYKFQKEVAPALGASAYEQKYIQNLIANPGSQLFRMNQQR